MEEKGRKAPNPDKAKKEPTPLPSAPVWLNLNPSVFTAIVLALIALAIFTRFIALDYRPIHHDESMFSYYAHYWSRTGSYDYQPILHGPLMLYVTGAFLILFGDSTISMRSATALLGIGIILLVLRLKRWLSNWAILAVMLFLIFSPGIMFYSRFFRFDVSFLFFSFVAALLMPGLVKKDASPWQLFYVVIVFITMLSMMENWGIVFICFSTFGILAMTVNILQQRHQSRKQKLVRLHYFATKNLAVGALCGIIIIALLFLFYAFTAEGTLKVFSVAKFLTLKSPFWQYFAVLCLLTVLTAFFAWMRANIVLDTEANYLATRFWLHLSRHWAILLIGIVTALALYILFFTDFFKFSHKYFIPNAKFFKKLSGIFKIYRDTFAYWYGQHQIHRIKGEFHFYLVILFLYELPALMIVIAGAIAHLWQKKWIRHWLIPGFFGFALILALALSGVKLKVDYWDKTFHMTSKWHIFMLVTWLLFGTVLTINYLLQQRRFFAMVWWWLLLSFPAYSYGGEKVPWLSIHITLPMILLAGLYINDFIQSQKFLRRPVFWLVIFGLLVLWQARNSILLNFYYPDCSRERMNYAQSLKDVKFIADQIEHLTTLLGTKEKPKVIIRGEIVWLMRWYLRNYPNWTEYENVNTTTAPIVVENWTEAEKNQNLQQNYRVSRYSVRSWWQPTSASIKPMLGIWRWLIPRQYRKDNENAKLLRESIDEWKKVLNWVLYRKTFDHYGAKYPTYSTVDCAFCIRKDVFY